MKEKGQTDDIIGIHTENDFDFFTGWVVVRDIENDLSYEGWIQASSISNERDELFIRDVKVLKNSTAQELYEVPAIYLPRKRENLVIEFLDLGLNKNSNKDTQFEEIKNETR